MISTIREHAIVKSPGTITITSPELVEGSEVEVLILIEDADDDSDTTDYLLSDEVNRERLLNSISDADEHPEDLISFEDYEKRLASS